MTSSQTYAYPDPGEPHGLTTTLVVGLEIHVELATQSKMWTDAPNVAHPDHFDAEPNTLLSPVAVGLPGTLPVMNKAAVEMSVQVGLALNCSIAPRAKWDRKSYYYPDLPKNYQISQYDRPLCFDGTFEVLDADETPDDSHEPSSTTINIVRAHLEEDAGKLLHELPGGGYSDGSLVDLNRAGTPLLEIVTAPDFTSAEQAVRFCTALRDLCRHLGVTEGIMQRGHMRFEPNINVVIANRKDETFKTPIVEVKNLNSFRAVHGAITHEHHRQVEAWLADGRVMSPASKSTRGWDDGKLETTPQREKEDADDYRYFPDPDLVEVAVDPDWLEGVRTNLPELPAAKRKRYVDELGLKPVDAETLLAEPATTRFFEACLDASSGIKPPKLAAFLLNVAAARANEQNTTIDQLGVSPQQAAGIVALLDDDKIGSSAAAPLLVHCETSDEPAEALAEKHGLIQVSDEGALDEWVDTVIKDPKLAKAIDDVRGGNGKAIGALVGAVMKLSKGQANPKAVSKKLAEKINA
ncbi:MAG: Asp-tRNA(Asn)/Glu-tRNA(Gln) amidotransferase subunit GatB [Planctomycetota bacterium]